MTAFLEVLNRQGGLSRENMGNVLTGRPRNPGEDVTRADIQRIREKSAVSQTDAHPRAAETAKRTLKWLELATASTAAERHDLIRQFPVTVVNSMATDGRAGIVKSFVTRGRTRFRLFVSSASSHQVGERTSGPGPVDLGQDPACYDDYGELTPCANEQDIEDAVIATVELDAQVVQTQADIEALGPEMDGEMQGGPCEVLHGCAREAATAGVALVTGAAVVVRNLGAVADVAASGAVVSGLTVAGWYLGAFGAGLAIGWTAGTYIACRIYGPQASLPDAPFDLPLVYELGR